MVFALNAVIVIRQSGFTSRRKQMGWSNQAPALEKQVYRNLCGYETRLEKTAKRAKSFCPFCYQM